MNEKHRQIFADAVNLVSDPAHWTRSSWARNKDGRPISDYNCGNNYHNANHKEACQWCIEGAIMKVSPNVEIAKAVINRFGANVNFNDKFYSDQHIDFINECERKLKS